VLRVAGYGAPKPLLEKYAQFDDGSTLWRSSEGWTDPWFFRGEGAGEATAGSYYIQYFDTPKPPDVFRVATFGASTVQGFPFPPGLTISNHLGLALADALPEKRVESLNFGFTAVASYPVSRALEEALPVLEADAVVILAGHNEFFGAYGVASSQYAGSSRTALRLHEGFNRLRLVVGARALVQGAAALARSEAGNSTEDTARLIEIMAGDDAIRHDDPRREKAAALLRANISAMIDQCEAAGVPVVVCTLPSNLSTFAPVGPVTADPAADAALWAAAAGAESANERILLLEAGVAKDPNNALRHFRLGEARAELDQTADAVSAFKLARDLDGMPWRAPSRTNDAIRELATARNVTLADAEERFNSESPGGPGWDLFVDHVHPSTTGRALYGIVLAEGVLRATGNADRIAALPAVEDLRRAAGGEDLLNLVEAAKAMEKLFSLPPMSRNNEAAHEFFATLYKRIHATLSPLEKQAVAQFEKLRAEGEHPQIAYVGAMLRLQHADLQDAAESLRYSRQAYAPHESAFIQSAISEALARAALNQEPDARLRRDLDLARRGLQVLRMKGEEQEFALDFSEAQLLMIAGDTGSALARMRQAHAKAPAEAKPAIEMVMRTLEPRPAPPQAAP
jgi:hypothetical protein